MTAAISDPALLERLRIADEAFMDHFVELIANFPAREWTPEGFEHGLRYPWTRPERSFLLHSDGHADLLHDLAEPERRAVLERHLAERSGRVALLAFGSNTAPKNLAVKLAHHEDPQDREVLVLAGELHGLDVVASASIAFYGAMPATLAASPGTRVRAAVLLVTGTQLTTLAWGEIPYRLGRLHGAPFTVEEGVEGVRLDTPVAFVSRWGAFAPDGEPIALAAIPAAGRRYPARTQRELIDRAASIVLGPEADAEALMQLVCSGPGAAAARALPALRPFAQPFDFAGWTPMAADGTFPHA